MLIIQMGEPKEMMNLLKQMIDQHRGNDIARAILNYHRPRELVQCFDLQGKNVFFRAIEIQDQEACLRTLDYLVKQGGDIRHKDLNKQTILYFACRHEKQEIVRYLLTFNFPLNDDDFFNQTPLFYAAKYNRSARVSDALLRAGCDVNHKDGNGQTCLFYAASAGNMEIIKLYVEFGANVQLIDKNREKAANYARKNGHHRAVDYLNNCKTEIRRVKEEQSRRVQESSQNTVEPKRKKETSRNQYCLVYTNQNGETRVLTNSELAQFRATSEQHERLFRLMSDPEDPIQGLGPIPDKKFQRLALKILNYFNKLQNSHYFQQPVNFIALGLADYPSIIRHPMDFGTIRRKLSLNAYLNELQFQEDMNLIFDNCILYNGTDKDLGKIALQMKMEFNTMFVKEFSG